MAIDLAGVPTLMWVFIAVFVVIPAVRWSLPGIGWQRRRLERLGLDLDLTVGSGRNRGSNRQIAELREELESRLADVDLLTSRVAELENRLDFTERLLTRQRAAEALAVESTTHEQRLG